MATADRACAPACPPVRDTPARARRSVAGSRRRKPSLRLPVALAAVVATVPGALAGAASASFGSAIACTSSSFGFIPDRNANGRMSVERFAVSPCPA